MFSEKDHAFIYKTIQDLSIRELKVNCFFYYMLYEKAEEKMVERKKHWDRIEYALIKDNKNMLKYRDDVKDRIQENRYDFINDDMHRYYLSTNHLFNNMPNEKLETTIYNLFQLATLIDVSLTSKDQNWHPAKDYALVLSKEKKGDLHEDEMD